MPSNNSSMSKDVGDFSGKRAARISWGFIFLNAISYSRSALFCA
jgi:hypothetical protein